MDTHHPNTERTPEPIPARDGRLAPSRCRVLVTSVAVAGFTAVGGLAVTVSAAATSSTVAPTTTDAAGGASTQVSTAPQASATGGTPSRPTASATPVTNSVANGPRQPGGQPPQIGQGAGHASTGGS